MEEINITRILSVPASPEYNPIEGCFSIVKNYFKRQRLNCLVNNKAFEVTK
jgi:transposase